MTIFERGRLIMYEREGMQNGIGLIVSNNLSNRYNAYVSIAPLVEQTHEGLLPSQVRIPLSKGIPTDSIIVGEQTGPVEKTRITNVLDIEIENEVMLQINQALAVHFGIDSSILN